jgi:hypothetical protein
MNYSHMKKLDSSALKKQSLNKDTMELMNIGISFYSGGIVLIIGVNFHFLCQNH